MSTPFAPEDYPLLTEIINETYTDEIDEILEAREEDNGDFIVLARDGAKLLGIQITDETIRIRIVNPADLGSDDAEPPAEPTQPTNPTDSLSFAQGDEPSTPELYLQRLRREASGLVSEWVGALEGLLSESSSLEEFRAGLDAVFPELDSEGLAVLMAEALSAARLAGLYEAQEQG